MSEKDRICALPLYELLELCSLYRMNGEYAERIKNLQENLIKIQANQEMNIKGKLDKVSAIKKEIDYLNSLIDGNKEAINITIEGCKTNFLGFESRYNQ